MKSDHCNVQCNIHTNIHMYSIVTVIWSMAKWKLTLIAKLSVSNPNNAVALFFRDSVPLDNL